MAVTGSDKLQHALYPLTVFDTLFPRTTFVTGWLVEGDIDTAVLAAALDRLTRKWRLLSGRLHTVKTGSDTKWYVKIPLGPLPEGYPTYTLTASISAVPLSKYVKVPIPSTSTSLPMSVFLDSKTPKQSTDWESTAHPLTCWNVVSFPASTNNGVPYTGIGFARSHGIFDGGGASQIVDALIAEIKGQEWLVPPDPHEGLNHNPVEQVLAEELRIAESGARKEYQDYSAYSPLGMTGFVRLVAYHTKEKLLKGADRRIILLPKTVLAHITDDVRTTLRKEKKQVENVSTGDILVAWIFKTVFSTGFKPTAILHCTNVGNFRHLLQSRIEMVSTYPHNAFAPLPYPLLTAADIQAFPLHSLANLFSASRASFSLYHVVTAYKTLHQACFPTPPDAEETLMVSNVSASRILESDWTCLGSKRTVCSYRYQATPTDTLFTNAVYIAGRLDDGSVVLDVTLNKVRFDLLSGEIQRLSARLARNQLYGGTSKAKRT